MEIELCKKLEDIRDELSEETLIQLQDIKYEDDLVCEKSFVPKRCLDVRVYCPSYQEYIRKYFLGISDVPDVSDIVIIDVKDYQIITIGQSTRYIVDLLEEIISLGGNFPIDSEVKDFFDHTPQIICQTLKQILPHFVNLVVCEFNQFSKRNIFLFNDRPSVYTYHNCGLFSLSSKEISATGGFWIMSKIIFSESKYSLSRIIDVIIPPSIVDRINFDGSWKCISLTKPSWSESTRFVYQYNKEVYFNMDSLGYAIRRVIIETLLDIPIIYPDFLDTSLNVLRNVK